METFLRISLGLLAAVFLLIAAVWHFRFPDANPFHVGIMVRVGAVLAAICLAFPHLKSIRNRIPAMMIGVGILLIFIVAARGNQGRVIVGLIVLAISVGGVLKWLAKIANDDPRKR